MGEEPADDDRRGDPFEQLDHAVGDREGDPFEQLDAEMKLETEEDDGPAPGIPGNSNGSEMRSEIDRRESAESGEGPSLLGDRNRDGDPFGALDDAFAETDVDQVDPDTVWQELTSAQSRGSVGEMRDRTYADVSKHSYCEQCEYFSEPPDVNCTHEGTEIVEFLDMETVRVVDCPVVTERKKLADGAQSIEHHGKD